MKIIIVGTAYPYRGGLSAFNERIAQEFQKRGDNVEIYTFTLQYPAFLFPGKTQFSEEPAPGDLKILRKVNSINPFNWIRTGNEIRKKKPDILIFKFWIPFMAPCFGTIERIVRKNKYTSIISILDNVIPHEKRFADRLLSGYFIRATQGFVAMSKSVLSDIDLFDKRKPRIFCPHPLYDHYGDIIPKNEALSLLSLNPEYHYVLFFGFIRPYKGLDLLIEAFGTESMREKKIRLIVAGEFYENEDSYLNLIKKLKLEESIMLHTDFIPNSKVNLYFSACDIVAQPYKTATQSGVTQIAYHFEKPMLVTDVGGLSEIVPDGKVGYVVQPDSNEIAKALVDYFEQDRQREFSDNVKREKQKYLWSNMTAAILKLYNQIKTS